LIQSGRAQVYAATDDEAMLAVIELSKSEGIIPALETAHALAILQKMDLKPDENVVICLSGRGDKDLNTYLQYIEDNEIRLTQN
jgi:tryptophan synthase beta chain